MEQHLCAPGHGRSRATPRPSPSVAPVNEYHGPLDRPHGGGRVVVAAVCEHTFVRWDNLRRSREEARRLPGLPRTGGRAAFDAPEALDTRFYEVRAKSALNRVPARSRMPFRWTINPYRGCTMPAPIALGRHADPHGRRPDRALADIRAGDRIYGTVRRGKYRRYVDHRGPRPLDDAKPAYRVTLADGTELVASGDHRFLTDRGWKHVVGA